MSEISGIFSALAHRVVDHANGKAQGVGAVSQYMCVCVCVCVCVKYEGVTKLTARRR